MSYEWNQRLDLDYQHEFAGRCVTPFTEAQLDAIGEGRPLSEVRLIRHEMKYSDGDKVKPTRAAIKRETRRQQQSYCSICYRSVRNHSKWCDYYEHPPRPKPEPTPAPKPPVPTVAEQRANTLANTAAGAARPLATWAYDPRDYRPFSGCERPPVIHEPTAPIEQIILTGVATVCRDCEALGGKCCADCERKIKLRNSTLGRMCPKCSIRWSMAGLTQVAYACGSVFAVVVKWRGTVPLAVSVQIRKGCCS